MKKKSLIFLVVIIVSGITIGITGNTGRIDKNEKEDSFSIVRISAGGNYSYDADLGIMLCLDTSGSMGSTGIQQTKDAAHVFLDLMGNDTYIGLVTYNWISYLDVGLDRLGNGTQMSDMVAGIDAMAAGGNTNIYDGLMDCIQEFNGSTFESKYIILMTDGIPNEGLDPFDNSLPPDYNAWANNSNSPAVIATNNDICINTIGFGLNYDELLLKIIANTTSCGKFFNATDSLRLAMAFAEIGNEMEGWDNQETNYGDVTNGGTVKAGRYNINGTCSTIRIWVQRDITANNLSLVVKDNNNNTLTPTESGGTKQSLYEIYDCKGLDYIDIYIHGNYTTSSITQWGVITGCKEGSSRSKIKVPGYEPIFFYGFLIISILLLITKIKISKKKNLYG